MEDDEYDGPERPRPRTPEPLIFSTSFPATPRRHVSDQGVLSPRGSPVLSPNPHTPIVVSEPLDAPLPPPLLRASPPTPTANVNPFARPPRGRTLPAVEVVEANRGRFERDFHHTTRLTAHHSPSNVVFFRSTYHVVAVQFLVKCVQAIEPVHLLEVFAHAVLPRHPNVHQYHGCWTEPNTASGSDLFIVLTHPDGGSLGDIPRASIPFTEPQLLSLLHDCAQGLQVLHGAYLAHLGLHPGAVYCSHTSLDQTAFVVGDLWRCRSIDPAHTPHPLLPLSHAHAPYAAPELEASTQVWWTSADVFSLGAIALEMASGQCPPPIQAVQHASNQEELSVLLPRHSCHLTWLLKTMVATAPCDRPTLLQVVATVECLRELRQHQHAVAILRQHSR